MIPNISTQSQDLFKDCLGFSRQLSQSPGVYCKLEVELGENSFTFQTGSSGRFPGKRKSPLFLLQLPPIHSAPTCSRVPEKSRNSCRSTQTSSLRTVVQPLHLNMEYSTTYPQLLVLQFLPKPGVWILRS